MPNISHRSSLFPFPMVGSGTLSLVSRLPIRPDRNLSSIRTKHRSGKRPPFSGVFTKGASLFALVVLVLAFSVAGPVCWGRGDKDQEFSRETHLKLLPGAKSQNYQFAYPLPEEEFDHGTVWVGRKIETNGDLSIVEEVLRRDIYHVFVRLTAHPTRVASGTLRITLTKGPAKTALPPVLPPPTHLWVTGNPRMPSFQCRSQGNTTLFRLYDKQKKDEIWSRAFTHPNRAQLDQGLLYLRTYLLEVRQSNSAARYSEPSWLEFRLEKAPQTCPACQGSGVDPAPPQPADEPTPCLECNGTGQIIAPALIIGEDQFFEDDRLIGVRDEEGLFQPEPKAPEEPDVLPNPDDPDMTNAGSAAGEPAGDGA